MVSLPYCYQHALSNDDYTYKTLFVHNVLAHLLFLRTFNSKGYTVCFWTNAPNVCSYIYSLCDCDLESLHRVRTPSNTPRSVEIKTFTGSCWNRNRFSEVLPLLAAGRGHHVVDTARQEWVFVIARHLRDVFRHIFFHAIQKDWNAIRIWYSTSR